MRKGIVPLLILTLFEAGCDSFPSPLKPIESPIREGRDMPALGLSAHAVEERIRATATAALRFKEGVSIEAKGLRHRGYGFPKVFFRVKVQNSRQNPIRLKGSDLSLHIKDSALRNESRKILVISLDEREISDLFHWYQFEEIFVRSGEQMVWEVYFPVAREIFEQIRFALHIESFEDVATKERIEFYVTFERAS